MEHKNVDVVNRELENIKHRYSKIDGVSLEACVPVMVRFKIIHNEQKQLVACFMFPENYPHDPIIIELKSKKFSYRLIEGLTKVCEQEAKKLQGQQQILEIVKFVRQFLEENPLCVCSEEINFIKRELITEKDEIKLKQKTSQVVLKLREGSYFLNTKLTVPDDYPLSSLGVEITEHNFPAILKTNTQAQAIEISRRCVQPPLRKNPKAPPFEPKPSLRPVVEYLTRDIIRTHPKDMCPVCKERSLPENPAMVIADEKDDRFVERMYCKHLYHHGCLDRYMKIPPFTGGKKCPACDKRIYHEKWKLTPELAEARWAHKEARRRELDEVVEFLE